MSISEFVVGVLLSPLVLLIVAVLEMALMYLIIHLLGGPSW